MFSDKDQSCKSNNVNLNFKALINTSQYVDLSKLEDFLTDEIPEGKLLALELNTRSFANTVIPHFTNSRFTKPRNYEIDF